MRVRFIEVMEGLPKRCSGKPVKGRRILDCHDVLLALEWTHFEVSTRHQFKMEIIYYTQN